MSRRLAAMLAAEGLSLPPGITISYRGARAFARGWRTDMPGSIEQLRSYLQLVDPDVQLSVRDITLPVSSASVPDGLAAFGTPPSRIRRVVSAAWATDTMLGNASRLAAWCRSVADRWHPLDADEVHLTHNWRAGVGVEQCDAPREPSPDLPIPTSPAGARTILAVSGDVGLIKAGQLIVGNLASCHFLVNTHPVVPAWNVEHNVWVSLRPCHFVAIALDSERAVTITIDGRPVTLTAAGRGWCHAQLAEPLPAGARIRVAARAIDGPVVVCRPNPVTMIAINPRENNKAFQLLTESIPARNCETLLEGSLGLREAIQYLPAVPTSDLRHESTLRLQDVRSILEANLPGIRVGSLVTGHTDIIKSFRRTVRVGLTQPSDAAVSFGLWRYAAQRLLRHMVPHSIDWIIHSEELPHAD